MKEDRQKMLIWTLAILLVLAVGYIGVSAYQAAKQKQQISILQQGVQLGYEQAVLQLMQQAITCQQVPVTAQNQTLNLIAVECLQKAQKQ